MRRGLRVGMRKGLVELGRACERAACALRWESAREERRPPRIGALGAELTKSSSNESRHLIQHQILVLELAALLHVVLDPEVARRHVAVFVHVRVAADHRPRDRAVVLDGDVVVDYAVDDLDVVSDLAVLPDHALLDAALVPDRKPLPDHAVRSHLLEQRLLLLGVLVRERRRRRPGHAVAVVAGHVEVHLLVRVQRVRAAAKASVVHQRVAADGKRRLVLVLRICVVLLIVELLRVAQRLAGHRLRRVLLLDQERDQLGLDRGDAGHGLEQVHDPVREDVEVSVEHLVGHRDVRVCHEHFSRQHQLLLHVRRRFQAQKLALLRVQPHIVQHCSLNLGWLRSGRRLHFGLRSAQENGAGCIVDSVHVREMVDENVGD
mmetsp:Transcript_38726/g.91391  ORF Transcript_38726/g.91391 Transcript_38726/m.91391 type:complete len:377 (+) Transcript_38726:791-1921(+)